jgi:hypothetical protein
MIGEIMARPELVWERIENLGETGHGIHTIARAKVPGGWLVTASQIDGCGITFVPYSNYAWQ